MKEKGLSILVTLNNETSQPSILKSLVENKLSRFKDLKVAAVDKRNAVIDCPSPDVALEVAAILRVDFKDARVSSN